MASVNKIIIIGNVGRDPEVKVFASGDKVANLTVATTETWKDKQTGERKESTEWHRVVFRGGLAGIVEQYLRKGSQVYIEGSLKTRKYTDSAGVEKQTAEIMANTMTMLGQKADGKENHPAPSNPAPRPSSPPAPSRPPSIFHGEDDVPF